MKKLTFINGTKVLNVISLIIEIVVSQNHNKTLPNMQMCHD